MGNPENSMFYTKSTSDAALRAIRNDFDQLKPQTPETHSTSKSSKKKKKELDVDEALEKLKQSKSPLSTIFSQTELELIRLQASVIPAGSATLESNFSKALNLSERRHSSMTNELLEAQLFVSCSNLSVLKLMVIDILES